jgi:hypothetical protein
MFCQGKLSIKSLTILFMERFEEKAQLEFNCKTIDQLIDVLEDIRTVMGGDTKVGRVNNLRPSVDVKLFNYDDAIVVLN